MRRRFADGKQGQLKYKRATWFMAEAHVRVAGRWMYPFRAVGNRGDTAEFHL
jgi:transposase-like protein